MIIGNTEKERISVSNTLKKAFPSNAQYYHLSNTHPSLGKWYDSFAKPGALLHREWVLFNAHISKSEVYDPVRRRIQALGTLFFLVIPAIIGNLMNRVINWTYGEAIPKEEVEKLKKLWIDAMSRNVQLLQADKFIDSEIKFIETCIRHKIEINQNKTNIIFWSPGHKIRALFDTDGSNSTFGENLPDKESGTTSVVVLSPRESLELETIESFYGKINPQNMTTFKQKHRKTEPNIDHCEVLYFPGWVTGSLQDANRIRKVFSQNN
ncbi:MAG: hypothetical protein K1060chlam1_00664 [Candidatus Anoxychlamydiales bacterium]|nr:hypothetical protein [Candidatus Anoxychlamydiales bacterium]